jgi:hypothetical protein
MLLVIISIMLFQIRIVSRACKMRARALHCRLGLLRAWPRLVGGLRVCTAGLAQKPGPHGLGLLGYVVKARARSACSGLGLLWPLLVTVSCKCTCWTESHVFGPFMSFFPFWTKSQRSKIGSNVLKPLDSIESMKLKWTVWMYKYK